jgi:purine-nucleoside phosphorylase
MENQRKRGRPKKANAKKLGELNKGLRRYTFVADEKMIEKIKKEAKKKRVSIKALMSYILNDYFNKNKGSKDEYQSAAIHLFNYNERKNSHNF